jgi:hypothetical protein
LFDLHSGGSPPTIVVLSACLTAGTPGDKRHILAAGYQTAPMAATLVDGGIPIVLGMAGRVADITCRVFARKFGEAIIKGESLVRATAEARQMGAFAGGRDPMTTADWSFPAIFMAQAVPTDYTPVERGPTDDLWRTIEGWITAYNLPRTPVFCGREEFLQKFHRLFETPGLTNEDRSDDQERRRTLLAFVDTPEPGYGRTRLLQELASHAFRSGHLPVLLTFDTEDCPKDVGQLAREFDRAIEKVREVLDLGDSLTSQLFLLTTSPDARELNQSIARELVRSQGELNARVVRLAVASDLGTLLADARKKYSVFAEGQVVVLLDDIDEYGPLVPLLFKQSGGILDASGLSSSKNPVPVVATCSLGRDASDKLLRPIAEHRERPAWLETGWLAPFSENGEDLLAYELVLLNPEPGEVGWAFNDDVADNVRTAWEETYRSKIRGIPRMLNSGEFWIIADLGQHVGFTIKATDEELFKATEKSV